MSLALMYAREITLVSGGISFVLARVPGHNPQPTPSDCCADNCVHGMCVLASGMRPAFAFHTCTMCFNVMTLLGAGSLRVCRAKLCCCHLRFACLGHQMI